MTGQDRSTAGVADGGAGASGPRAIIERLRSLPPDEVVEIGVTAGEALAVMTVPPTPAGARYVPDQVYGRVGARLLTMHLYAATHAGLRRPGVVFIHGGGFVEGFPEMLIRYAAHLAAAGYVTASIDYRLVSEAPWPAPVEDAKCAVRWMRAHSKDLGLDPKRLGVAGASAGGYLAAMVASTPGRFEGAGGEADVSSAVSAAVLWYPVLDLDLRDLLDDQRARAAMADSDYPADPVAAASPFAYVRNAPPTLSFVGTADPIVPVSRVEAYHRRLEAGGTANRLVTVPGAGHSFDFALARWEECFAVMRGWFDHHLAGCSGLVDER